MRYRPLALIAAIFGAAALAALFVVSQVPREGQVSPPGRAAAPPPAPALSPPVERPFTAADGEVEVSVSAGGEPQAGAEVRLYLAPAEEGGPWRRAGEARTGSDGVARLFAAPGAYLVAARAAGLATGRTEVIRSEGAAARVDVELEPPAVLEGRTLAAAGGPVADANVLAVPLVSGWPGLAPASAPPEETAAAKTDADGAFRLEALAPGCWAISIEAPGHHPVLLPRVAVPGDALAVALEPLGAVEGIALLPDGGPAAGAVVRAATAEHGASAVTGPDGRFALAVPAGVYAVQASLGDRAGSAAAPVALAAGEAVRGVELRLGPAAALEARVSALAGGAPIAGAHVAVHPHESREIVARAVSGEDGRVRIAGLAPGAYDVRAAARGASPTLVVGVTLAPGARFPLRLPLPGTGAVEGVVRDPAGGPLAGVRVRVARPAAAIAAGAPLEARSDFEGRFRVDGLEVGRAEVVARQDGVLVGVSRAVQVAERRASKVELVLPEPGVLTGGIGVAGRPPPPGTTVVAVAMGAGPGALQVARAVAEAGGRYSLVLPAGEYRVHAAPGHLARTDLRVAPAYARIEPRQTSRLDLVLAGAEPEGGPEVLVLEPGGAPSSGAAVTLARPDDPRIALATSAGEDGRVAIGTRMGVAGRPVTIRARNGGRAGEESLVLPAVGTVVVRLRPGGSVEGVVEGRDPVSGFTVEVASQPSADAWRTVDVHRFAGDRFQLGDLPSEPLRLVVRADDGRRGLAEVRVGSGETRTVRIALAR